MINTTTISITEREKECLIFGLDCAIAWLEEEAQAETDKETRYELENGKEELEKLKKVLDNSNQNSEK